MKEIMNQTFQIEPHIQTIYTKKVSIELPLMEKLKILSDAAKYDVACTSSGVAKKNPGSGIGNSIEAGICQFFRRWTLHFVIEDSFYK